MRIGRHVEAIDSGRTLRHPIVAAGASLHGNGSRHAGAEHRFDDSGVHPGRRPAAATAAGQVPGKTLQHRRARQKRRPQSLGTTHMGSTSTCGPRALSSVTCWPRPPPLPLVSTFPTVRLRIACDASSYPVTTSTCLALERRRDVILTSEDDRTPGAHPVLVLSDAFWQRRFAGAPDVVGRTVSLNGAPFTVVGVAARGFFGMKPGFGPTSGRR